MTFRSYRSLLSTVICFVSLACVSGCSQETEQTPIAPEQGDIARYLAEHPEEAFAEEDSAEDESDSQE